MESHLRQRKSEGGVEWGRLLPLLHHLLQQRVDSLASREKRQSFAGGAKVMSSWLGSSTLGAATREGRVVSSLWCAKGSSLGQIERVTHGSNGDSRSDNSEVWP